MIDVRYDTHHQRRPHQDVPTDHDHPAFVPNMIRPSDKEEQYGRVECGIEDELDLDDKL